jgi:SagB-type dehydrogenase family enzyme
MKYVSDPVAERKLFQKNVAVHPRPARFKRYDVAVRRPLFSKDLNGPRADFDDVLRSRRTVRQFSRTPVRFEDLASVIGGTWGRTGWIDTEFGFFATKTSPSAGALHPIECYLLAWNVRGVSPGLYHYDVRADELRRLRSANPRAEAVKAASGQRWIGGAAFLCVLTAVFARSLWKYTQENAYRDVWLDAGHLAQTFCLLATSRGLGAFTTVAIQDTYIEKLIGLDGLKEFPVYLCGAGVPAESLSPSPR